MTIAISGSGFSQAQGAQEPHPYSSALHPHPVSAQPGFWHTRWVRTCRGMTLCLDLLVLPAWSSQQQSEQWEESLDGVQCYPVLLGLPSWLRGRPAPPSSGSPTTKILTPKRLPHQPESSRGWGSPPLGSSPAPYLPPYLSLSFHWAPFGGLPSDRGASWGACGQGWGLGLGGPCSHSPGQGWPSAALPVSPPEAG